ncbi:TPA: hypothetical protein J1387_004572 [Escherichia coli]|nr:hypothetical protein [Escherichia coli]
MSQKYLIRIAELESQLRQKDQQLSLVEETEAFLRSALARAEEKSEEDEPRQPDGCKLKTAPVRPVVAARPADYVCSEDLFY